LRELFTARINTDHARKAYLNATRRFAQWCVGRGIGQPADVQAFHVAAFVKHLKGKLTQTSSSSIPAVVDRHAALMKAQR
jgi:site-specific recombinase XerD